MTPQHTSDGFLNYAYWLQEPVRLRKRYSTPCGSKVTVVMVCVEITYTIEGQKLMVMWARMAKRIGGELASDKPLNVYSSRTHEYWYTLDLCDEYDLFKSVHREMFSNHGYQLRNSLILNWRESNCPIDAKNFIEALNLQLPSGKINELIMSDAGSKRIRFSYTKDDGKMSFRDVTVRDVHYDRLRVLDNKDGIMKSFRIDRIMDVTPEVPYRIKENVRCIPENRNNETTPMRIGHCQLDSTLGDFAGNLKKVVTGLEQADRDRVDIVSFPECFLTGYPDDGEVARRDAFTIDSPQIMQLLGATSHFEAAFIVGFNELRGADLYNTVVVVHKGHLLGQYSKCSAYMKFHRQGREFPVFTHKGLTFGVIICSDGGYIEPTRLLVLQGAQVIFAPHFNYIGAAGLISHFMQVRADHIARAVENSVYFVRGNNVSVGGKEECITGYEGIGYGDSYIVDPHGETVVRSRRHVEDVIFTDITPESDRSWGVGKSLWSAREFGKKLMEIADKSKE